MPIDGSMGLRLRNARLVDPGADRHGASASIVFARGALGRRLLLFGAFVVFFAAMAYIAAMYGVHAVVRCEMETNSALAQNHGAMSQIAMSNACGF